MAIHIHQMAVESPAEPRDVAQHMSVCILMLQLAAASATKSSGYLLERARQAFCLRGKRCRLWAAIAELEGRYLRDMTLGDRVAVHNAFPTVGSAPCKAISLAPSPPCSSSAR